MPREHKKCPSGSRSIMWIGTLLTGDMESSAHSLGDPDGDGEVQTPSTRRRPGSSSLGLGLAKAFERVSLPVVWAWASHIQFPNKDLAECCAVFMSIRGVCSSKDVWRSRSGPSRPSCQGPSGVACFCVSWWQGSAERSYTNLTFDKIEGFLWMTSRHS